MRRHHSSSQKVLLGSGQMKQPPSLEEQHKIAEEIVGVEIQWEEDGLKGFFLCPMAEGHTTPTKDKHTVCYLEGVPTFFCWHQSCKEWMENASSELRSKLDFRTYEERVETKIKAAQRKQLKYDALRLRAELERIYEAFSWKTIFQKPYSPDDSWEIFLGLWKPHDVIWIGDVWDTGEKGIGHFKTADDWRTPPPNRYSKRFTTASTFKPGTINRTLGNVSLTPYVVVEFDSLDNDPESNKLKGAALLNYLRPAFDLCLVIDSGNKSVHGWFSNDARMTQEAKFFLRQLGADMQTMRPSQPVRLAGAVRENGKIQSVLYVAG
jgi:hypothetical protein